MKSLGAKFHCISILLVFVGIDCDWGDPTSAGSVLGDTYGDRGVLTSAGSVLGDTYGDWGVLTSAGSVLGETYGDAVALGACKIALALVGLAVRAADGHVSL